MAFFPTWRERSMIVAKDSVCVRPRKSVVSIAESYFKGELLKQAKLVTKP
jgi:hypothetical protein